MAERYSGGKILGEGLVEEYCGSTVQQREIVWEENVGKMILWDENAIGRRSHMWEML